MGFVTMPPAANAIYLGIYNQTAVLAAFINHAAAKSQQPG